MKNKNIGISPKKPYRLTST